MNNQLQVLAASWIDAKAAETLAQCRRREIEDKMKAILGLPDGLEGTETAKPDGYVIKVNGRINRKVNADKLQELANENGLSEHLSTLFRWKPEINMSVWKETDKAITAPLLGAITSEPGRASFSITRGEK